MTDATLETTEAQYAFKAGFPHQRTDPNEVGKELERIEQIHGLLSADAVLREAENETSVLHPLFEWDDTEAARKFRLHQAGSLIRAVVIVRDDAPPVRKFVHIKPATNDGRKSPSRCFLNVESALDDPTYRAQLLNDAFSDLKHFRTRYESLSELAGIHSAIDSVLPIE